LQERGSSFFRLILVFVVLKINDFFIDDFLANDNYIEVFQTSQDCKLTIAFVFNVVSMFIEKKKKNIDTNVI